MSCHPSGKRSRVGCRKLKRALGRLVRGVWERQSWAVLGLWAAAGIVRGPWPDTHTPHHSSSLSHAQGSAAAGLQYKLDCARPCLETSPWGLLWPVFWFLHGHHLATDPFSRLFFTPPSLALLFLDRHLLISLPIQNIMSSTYNQ